MGPQSENQVPPRLLILNQSKSCFSPGFTYCINMASWCVYPHFQTHKLIIFLVICHSIPMMNANTCPLNPNHIPNVDGLVSTFSDHLCHIPWSSITPWNPHCTTSYSHCQAPIVSWDAKLTYLRSRYVSLLVAYLTTISHDFPSRSPVYRMKSLVEHVGYMIITDYRHIQLHINIPFCKNMSH